ncbi:hypothetical protein HAX54_023419, partial [Datura stramonium]|nr:hypothetical protein [Datura stramonium]
KSKEELFEALMQHRCMGTITSVARQSRRINPVTVEAWNKQDHDSGGEVQEISRYCFSGLPLQWECFRHTDHGSRLEVASAGQRYQCREWNTKSGGNHGIGK